MNIDCCCQQQSRVRTMKNDILKLVQINLDRLKDSTENEHNFADDQEEDISSAIINLMKAYQNSLNVYWTTKHE